MLLFFSGINPKIDNPNGQNQLNFGFNITLSVKPENWVIGKFNCQSFQIKHRESHSIFSFQCEINVVMNSSDNNCLSFQSPQPPPPSTCHKISNYPNLQNIKALFPFSKT